MFGWRFIGHVYDIRSDSWCTLGREVFGTLSEAKSGCNVDPLCAMFVDVGGRGDNFFSCKNDAEIRSSMIGSRLYIKQGNICVVLYHRTTLCLDYLLYVYF